MEVPHLRTRLISAAAMNRNPWKPQHLIDAVIFNILKMEENYRGRIEEEQKKEDAETEPGLVPKLEYTIRPAVLQPFCLPLKSSKYLKEHSPSRKHGVSEQQEEVWRRNCVDLIIRTGLKLQMYVDRCHCPWILLLICLFWLQRSCCNDYRARVPA